MQCPHGMSDPAWCDKCTPPAKKTPVTKSKPASGSSNVAARPVIGERGYNRQASTSAHSKSPIDVVLPDGKSYTVVGLTFLGRRFAAWTRSKFDSTECRDCHATIVKGAVIAKSMATPPKGAKAPWLCLPCWMHDKRDTPENNAHKNASIMEVQRG